MIKNKQIYGAWYHGTKESSAQEIMKKNIDVTIGGGEIGRGFYMGNKFKNAKIWAYHINKNDSKSKTIPKKAIVTFTIEPYISLRYQHISWKKGLIHYKYIDDNDFEKVYLFDKDLLYSKVFGKPEDYFFQLKWESKNAELFLNSKVTKIIESV